MGTGWFARLSGKYYPDPYFLILTQDSCQILSLRENLGETPTTLSWDLHNKPVHFERLAAAEIKRHGPASQDMEVQVENRLPGVPSGVYHQAKPTFVEAVLRSKMRAYFQHMSDRGLILFLYSQHRNKMLVGYDQDMHRRAWAAVIESGHRVVLVNNSIRIGLPDDFAKDAIRHGYGAIVGISPINGLHMTS